MIQSFLDGLEWGVWFLGLAFPFVGVYVLFRLFGMLLQSYQTPTKEEAEPKQEEEEEPIDFEFDFDEDPEIPVETPEPEVRYVATTIVRPPNIVRREDIEDDDED